MFVETEVGFEIVTPADGLVLHVYVTFAAPPALGVAKAENDVAALGSIVVPHAALCMAGGLSPLLAPFMGLYVTRAQLEVDVYEPKSAVQLAVVITLYNLVPAV